MNSRRPSHRRALAGLATIALLAAACAGSTAPTASTSASAAVATASPVVTPAASASAVAGSPGADPAATLSIAAPYTLAQLEGAQAQIDQITNGLGAMASIVQIGARQVKKAGSNDGLLLAMAFPGVPVPGSFLDTFAASAGGADAKVTSQTIGGQDVKLIEGTSTHAAAYAHGSTMIFVYGQSADETLAIVTAVIQASG
jgi:hypothetical protein